MSMRRFPASLTALRALAIIATVCAAAATFSHAQFRYKDFLGGVTIGILLVLVIALFSAHPAEVEWPDAQERREADSAKAHIQKKDDF
jgi:hypothetical protein